MFGSHFAAALVVRLGRRMLQILFSVSPSSLQTEPTSKNFIDRPAARLQPATSEKNSTSNISYHVTTLSQQRKKHHPNDTPTTRDDEWPRLPSLPPLNAPR